MQKYLLNSAVLTAFGQWEYQPLTVEAAQTWLASCPCGHALSSHFMARSGQPVICHCGCASVFEDAPWWTSTIGYQETATALEVLLAMEPGSIPVNRVQIQMEPGDAALVFRLALPPGAPRLDPQDKGALGEHLAKHHWELGLLTRLS